jgi:glutamyl-tRNA synthetase
VEMADQAEFYFREDFQIDEKAEKKHLTQNIKEPLEKLLSSLGAAPEIDEKGLEEIFRDLAAAKNLKLGAIAQAVRVALTGKAVSPGIYEVMRILGKEEVLKRISRAVKKL